MHGAGLHGAEHATCSLSECRTHARHDSVSSHAAAGSCSPALLASWGARRSRCSQHSQHAHLPTLDIAAGVLHLSHPTTLDTKPTLAPQSLSFSEPLVKIPAHKSINDIKVVALPFCSSAFCLAPGILQASARGGGCSALQHCFIAPRPQQTLARSLAPSM